MPWWIDYYQTGHLFGSRRALIGNLIGTWITLSMVLLLFYLFVQKNRSYQSENSELQRLSITDHLTQIHNSRFFHVQLEKEVERANRQKALFSLLFLDVDYFKKYNDDQGHAAGDEVLREIGRIIRRVIREGVDCGARYGGDEFSVILIDSNLQAAYEIGERIRLALNQSRNGAVSLSMGIACFRKGDSADGLFKRADDAMYRAKKKGRNRIEVEAWTPSTLSHFDQTA
ncbi:MAG TPA: GGDEF domain-containing protein [Candidatus Manganitrophaceae bacterium]|nr:GGDEF domain-containing protein [Candidatus Manganitrophaceae bacterium]